MIEHQPQAAPDTSQRGPYDILVATHPDQMAAKVNARIQQGFIPLGGVSVVPATLKKSALDLHPVAGHLFFQAVVFQGLVDMVGKGKGQG